MAIRSRGLTESERRLADLCQKTFLSLWSYPNLWKAKGKELCDLLVVYDGTAIIFSDKSCKVPEKDLRRDWQRWYRRAISESADQLYGAERWLRSHPTRVYQDVHCIEALPFDLTSITKIFRVVVARGARDRCISVHGGIGTLRLDPTLQGESAHLDGPPFTIGQVDPSRGFIHVLDEVSLELVLHELDTVSDLIRYLERKEEFLSGGSLGAVSGEENLLAWYLTRMGTDGGHDFVGPVAGGGLVVPSNEWSRFVQGEGYKRRREANGLSRLWDGIIEEFATHTRDKTLYQGSEATFDGNERAIRYMARESRLARRVLSLSLWDNIQSATAGRIRIRQVAPDHKECRYVFLAFPQGDKPEDQYRAARRNCLDAYCYVAAWKYGERRVIGIAAEGPHDEGRSWDVEVIEHPAEWTREERSEVRRLQQKHAMLLEKNQTFSHVHADEYPSGAALEVTRLERPVRGGAKCPCGSGRKYKRCCGANDAWWH